MPKIKKKYPNLKMFEKGHQRNRGRPKLTDIERECREALRSEIAKVAVYLTFPHDKAIEFLKSNQTSALHQVLLNAIEKNDTKTINDLFIRRMLGDTTKVVDTTFHDGSVEKVLTQEQKIKVFQVAIEELQDDLENNQE